MIDTELKPCPFCGKIPVLEIIGLSWVRLTTTCDDACLLHNKEFDYSLSEENRQLLIDDWIRRTPQDNWIPIDNREGLFIDDDYIIQFDNWRVMSAVYKGNGVFWLNKNGAVISDVKYWQNELPEPRK